MRQWVTPRSVMLHVAFLAIATGCLIAGWWQIHRAMQGNTLSYLYSIEWPAFVVVAGIGWWQMFHDTPEDIAKRKEHHARMRAASAEVVARTLPRSARAITVGSEETDGSTALPGASARAIGAGDAGEDEDRLLPVARPGALDVVNEGGLLDDEGGLLDDEDVPADEMTAYNRYLALLAVKGKTKTWRNPHGI